MKEMYCWYAQDEVLLLHKLTLGIVLEINPMI